MSNQTLVGAGLRRRTCAFRLRVAADLIDQASVAPTEDEAAVLMQRANTISNDVSRGLNEIMYQYLGVSDAT